MLDVTLQYETNQRALADKERAKQAKKEDIVEVVRSNDKDTVEFVKTFDSALMDEVNRCFADFCPILQPLMGTDMLSHFIMEFKRLRSKH